MAIISELPRLTLNALTAAPLLRLLIAMHGEETPGVTPSLTWEAFKQFIRVPYVAGPDVVSFQGTTTPDELAMPQDPPMYYVTLSRELDLSDGLGSWSRVVQIQWVFDVPKGGLSDVEHWSNEFPDLEAFAKHVESLSQFEALLANGDLADLYTVDLGPDGVPL